MPTATEAASPRRMLLVSDDTKKAANAEVRSVPSIPIFTMPVRSHMIPTIAARASGSAKAVAVETTDVVMEPSFEKKYPVASAIRRIKLFRLVRNVINFPNLPSLT
ncbi:unannotated protein [freshwater metagenome]|uniref:Unannotated protein n=1 Tax=freshwater metagenome TaxID=449393 RepID=A0A6J7VH14_9ZZZZ